MFTGSLQHRACNGALLLCGKPSDSQLHVTCHLDAQRVEVRRIIELEATNTVRNIQPHVVASTLRQAGRLLRKQRLLLASKGAVS